ncbi:unnamed protein product [Symbiodinium sp. CCMP2592]|nr:unnamed protein product [Symbiodinium sp. CCMP2592]
MLEDITTSEAFKNKMEQMLTAFSKHDEWHYISMDATLKLCMKIMGQAPYRASKQVRNDAPFGDDVAWRRLLTVRGRTGAVLLMEPLPKESSDYIVGAISDNFSEAQLVSVHYVGTDSPSEKLYTELRSVCPNLRALMLDPIHLAIVYEYGFWNKKSPGSKKLRHILRKCTAVDERVDARHWLAFYDGAMARPLNEEEVKYRDMILDFSMSERDASSILDHVQEDQPFLHRLDFIKSIAALCRRYKGEVVRKAPGPNKEIYRILWSACAPDRVEWLMNNVRVRHSMHASYLWFLPSGTASNEALHAEVNSWTRSINVMHRSTLALKLRYFKYIKMLTHYLATEHPMSHVVSANMLIGRSLHESLWSVPEWDAWCSEQHTDGVQSKARLQLAKSRQSEVKLVRNWAMKTMKKPAAKSSKPQKRKHFHAKSAFLEVLQLLNQIVGLRRLLHLGQANLWICSYAILICLNSVVTPLLHLSSSVQRNTFFLVLFDAFVDAMFGAVLPACMVAEVAYKYQMGIDFEFVPHDAKFVQAFLIGGRLVPTSPLQLVALIWPYISLWVT